MPTIWCPRTRPVEDRVDQQRPPNGSRSRTGTLVLRSLRIRDRTTVQPPLAGKKDQSTWIPNSVIAAAWKFGKGKEVHQALKSAAMEGGEPILQRAVALKIAREASGIASEALANAIDDPTLASELRESLSEFESYRIDQRPAFILRSAIGDSAVFSGIFRRGATDAGINGKEIYVTVL
jgi:predicted DsbA family dithiol-disulfide isomerase